MVVIHVIMTEEVNMFSYFTQTRREISSHNNNKEKYLNLDYGKEKLVKNDQKVK